MSWSEAAPARATFAGCLGAGGEAFAIVPAGATLRGWRPAVAGTAAPVALLAALVLGSGPLPGCMPPHRLRLVLGILLPSGMGRLRRPVLRTAGLVAPHDEEPAPAGATAQRGAGVPVGGCPAVRVARVRAAARRAGRAGA